MSTTNNNNDNNKPPESAATANTVDIVAIAPCAGAESAQTLGAAVAQTASVSAAAPSGGSAVDAAPQQVDGTEMPLTITRLRHMLRELDQAHQQSAATRPSLTIAGLCEMLRKLGDAEIDAASLITPLDLSFVWSSRGPVQKYKQNPEIAADCLTPNDLKGHNTISLSGTAVPAADLLAVLEPCLKDHGNTRVCVRLRRATADCPRAVALATDDLLFKDDPRTATEIKAVSEVVEFVKTMVEMKTIEPTKIVAAASALMPAGWSASGYCVDGVFFGSWSQLKERLPRLFPEDTESLFTTFRHEGAFVGSADHGRFDLVASVPGITLAALTDAFGPKKYAGCKVARLLAAANASVGSASATASSP
ncbi:hypothetical protein psal_cds_442 [Pandoravirus salinus]|uniref:Uncharacterized protein n=1 Tax=Pandoravirus salinus TaxID=1349410 RepID=S4VV00_9VIRU|nr:hypothetical protein psal_cds_442 [Pandoravirus salinus]AGO84193.1 hypothetical protein psal_cds_442 [Pandoravirus salinus]